MAILTWLEFPQAWLQNDMLIKTYSLINLSNLFSQEILEFLSSTDTLKYNFYIAATHDRI